MSFNIRYTGSVVVFRDANVYVYLLSPVMFRYLQYLLSPRVLNCFVSVNPQSTSHTLGPLQPGRALHVFAHKH
jgi:hypothetical protein